MRVALYIMFASLLVPATSVSQDFDPHYLGTFSIIVRDPATGEMGMAVQSKAFAAGNRAITLKGGLAVIAHQASSNPMYGEVGIQLLEAGMSPQQALEMMLRGDEGRDSRQVSILDIQGRSASWSGKNTNDWKGHKCGPTYCAQGNILSGPEVVDALARSFESSTGPLAERLMDALDAAQAAGGDARGMQSAALVIVKPLAGTAGFSDRVIDLRVDDHASPLVELRRILNRMRSGEIVTESNAKLRSGDTPAALRLAMAAREKSPDNDNVFVALAGVYLKMNQKKDALDALRKAVELNYGNKRMIPRNPAFDALKSDPEFQKIVGQ